MAEMGGDEYVWVLVEKTARAEKRRAGLGNSE